ncbi:MAG: FAD-dependent oxidoreductase [Flavobacterium sp.]|nr:FAD-dependent oxidoreductase [Flavobacterium sp.]
MLYDYLIVGAGLAGIAFAETAIQNEKNVIVVSDDSQNSSVVAGGLYNPVILKRFTEVWQSQSQLNLMTEFYAKLEQKLNSKFDYKIPLLRKFYSVEEQNNWFTASDKPGLINYLSTNLIGSNYKSIDAPFGYGEVLQTGYVDTFALIEAYKSYLKSTNSLIEETFSHDKVIIQEEFLEYKNLKVKQIVFAEGFGMLSNPFFKTLPLDGAKGELLLIKAPNLNVNVIIKSSIFILPIGNDLYKVGATYNWVDKSSTPTEEAKLELLNELNELIQCDYEVLEHYAGVRPTVKDRKPMLGSHPVYNNLHVLNGLGTRGVMLAPAMAKMLFDSIEKDIPLDDYVNIRRFKNAFSSLYQNE